VLGGIPLFWDEDDLQAAYGETKACDFVLDAGDCLVLFEVVSGQIKTGTRVDLARQAFDDDVRATCNEEGSPASRRGRVLA
jgi:hypothetical protein